jgi:hypothetical protein
VNAPRQCFVSYSHADHAAFQRLCVHLGAVARLFSLKVWHDERLTAGDYWNARIENAIAQSDIFVALVTNDFFHSGYIADRELPAILQRHRANGALVVPIIYRESCWRGYFGHYVQVIPSRSGRICPVADWRPVENGFAVAANGIQAAIEDWYGIQPMSPLAAGGGRGR